MLADFFTKPLQGALFVKLRDVIMGITHVNSLMEGPSAPPLERVGNEIVSGNSDGPNGHYNQSKEARTSDMTPKVLTYASALKKNLCWSPNL